MYAYKYYTICTCSMPFLKEKTSDEVIYSQQVVEVLSLLGMICFTCNNNRLKCEIAKSIGALNEGKYRDKNLDKSNGMHIHVITVSLYEY